MSVSLDIIPILGWSASTILIVAYVLLVIEKIDSKGHTYNVMNLFASVLLTTQFVLISLWPMVFLQVAWICVSVFGIYRNLKVKKL